MTRLGPLDRLPALVTTSVGSLPHSDAAAAVKHAIGAYELPACPQLPLLDGDMLSEWLGADPGRCGWAPDRDRERPRAWEAWLAALVASPPTHGVVKLQVTGPLTLAAGLERAAGRTGCGHPARELAAELAVWIAATISSWTQELSAIGLSSVVVIDEPGLTALGATPSDAALWDPIRAIAPDWGLHVCGPVPWDLLEAARPRVLSLDLVRYPLERGSDATSVAGSLLASGSRLALGVLDAPDPRHERDVAPWVRDQLQLLASEAGLDPIAVATRIWLTPTCGTGRLSVQREQLVAARLAATAALLRQEYHAAGAIARQRPVRPVPPAR